MSLLTKEQQDDANRIRDTVNWIENDVVRRRIKTLLAIIDDLQARAPKQLTTQELHLAFQKQISDIDWRANDGRVYKQYDEWLKCARFLGALKEKQ